MELLKKNEKLMKLAKCLRMLDAFCSQAQLTREQHADVTRTTKTAISLIDEINEEILNLENQIPSSKLPT